MKAPDYVANFDSASAMLRATARFLRGRDFPTLGVRSPLEPVAPLLRRLPDRILEQLYIWSGASEAMPAERTGHVDAEEISRWAVAEYPHRQFPAAFVGSSNGALVHLAVALGAPFLPQTFLVPVRRSGIHPDDPVADMEWGREPGRRLLEANPDLQLHHMHDPNQDRLMIQRMTYFRVKRRILGATYTAFLEARLLPGSTLFVVETQRRWPVTTVAERHYFQPGAMGGLEPGDYLHGSPAVAEYLERYGSPRRRWEPPPVDDEQPEAEWGFEPALRDDLANLAERRELRLRRIVFTDPEDLSPLVAELHRWWYRRRGIEPSRLVADSFIVMEPWWTLRTASVPWWAKFGVIPSVERLERYLDAAEPYDEIGLMLFNHGTEGAGFAPIDRWRSVLARARRRGFFIGVDERKYPRDFTAFKAYHEEMRRLRPRFPIPERLSLDELDEFLAQSGGRFAVEWPDATKPPRRRPAARARGSPVAAERRQVAEAAGEAASR
jgi:hypothetical protein